MKILSKKSKHFSEAGVRFGFYIGESVDKSSIETRCAKSLAVSNDTTCRQQKWSESYLDLKRD